MWAAVALAGVAHCTYVRAYGRTEVSTYLHGMVRYLFLLSSWCWPMQIAGYLVRTSGTCIQGPKLKTPTSTVSGEDPHSIGGLQLTVTQVVSWFLDEEAFRDKHGPIG